MQPDWSSLVPVLPWIGAGAGLVVVGVLGAATAFAAEQRLRPAVLPVLVLLLCVMPPIALLLIGRDVGAMTFREAGIDAAGPVAWLLRMTTFTIVMACLMKIVASQFRLRPVPAEGRGLYVALAVYVLTNNLLPAAFGTVPRFDADMAYPLIVFGALVVGRFESREPVLRAARLGLLLLAGGSLVVAFLLPPIAVEPRYGASVLPGVDFRLWGIGAGPNATGPAALVALLLLMHQPLRVRLLHWLALACATAVLVLAQSKTTWLAAAVVLPWLALYRRRLARGRAPSGGAPTATRTAIAAALVTVAAGVAFAFTDLGVRLADLAGTREFANLASLTGRSDIWRLALDAWADNPLFGYGWTIWGEDHRAQIRMAYALTAHNQFLQSLGRSGAVGLAGLLLYLAVLGHAAWRAAPSTRGLSLALLGFTLIRCVTETPMDLRAVLNSDYLAHLLVFWTALPRPSLAVPGTVREETVSADRSPRSLPASAAS